jgi:hypothetical protein
MVNKSELLILWFIHALRLSLPTLPSSLFALRPSPLPLPLPPCPILLKSPPIKEPALYFALDLSLCYKWEKFHKLHKQEEKTC